MLSGAYAAGTALRVSSAGGGTDSQRVAPEMENKKKEMQGFMIGIVILNYNSWQDAEECIQSICRSEQSAGYCIYLVDNASPERPSAAILRYLRETGVRLLQSDRNCGYSAGNNIGIKKALEDGCDAILISNTDVRYEPGSISGLKSYLDAHPDVGIVGPKIILGDGKLQRECMMFKTGPREKYLLRTRFHIFFPGYNRRYWGREHDYDRETFSVYAVMGCCFMMSRACALDVTPLDENTFLYEEELILGIHMERAGWKTVYYPGSVIHHLHGKTTERVKAFAYTCNVCSEIYYCREYLGMKRWEIWPLYGYRTAVYWGKCLCNREYQNGKKKYIYETFEEMRK